MLEGFSSLNCIDILYESMNVLSSERYLRSKDLKDNTFMEFVDPKFPVSGGYVRGPLTTMVTDDLVATPISSIDGVSYLERMNVSLVDLEEIVISIGVKEGLSILKASLTSTSSLTNGLNQYIGSGPVQANAALIDTTSRSERKKMKLELTYRVITY
ncbi:DUF674 family protein [Medicago truncatula]|uniref:DUF674 family protein n=1 Tax=Medicago truncatula TaxID=3880 RepID=A0A072UB73_MEDTR|nr:DUF674 family protein [Medicago truncatula]